MPFWLFMLAMNLLIPVSMIVLGARYRGGATREINGISGYRTRRSMASPEAWNHAHRLFGRIWLAVGLVLLPLTVAAMCPLIGASEGAIGLWGTLICFGQILFMSAPILPVEISLGKNFDENGNPKQK